jgi:drug/metabolite transporter (DMT)-like permease
MRVRGYAALYSSALLFSCTSLFVKLASASYAGLFVSGMRFVIGTILCASVLALRYRSLKPVRPGLVAMRGLLGAVSMIMSYAAISLTGPGRATLLGNTYPIFVVLFGALFFGERFRKGLLVSLAACTIGAFLVVRDGSGASLAGDLLALGSALFAGVAINFVRKATAFDNPFMLYLSPCLFGLPIIAFAPAPGGFASSLASGGAAGILLLIAVGGGAFLAQALMAYGYREVSAGSGSVVFYLETAATVVLGIAFAGEAFNLRCLAGLALIVAGLVFNQLRPRIEAGRLRRRGAV